MSSKQKSGSMPGRIRLTFDEGLQAEAEGLHGINRFWPAGQQASLPTYQQASRPLVQEFNLKGTNGQPGDATSIVLELDGFALLPSNPTSLLQPGDLVLVKHTSGVGSKRGHTDAPRVASSKKQRTASHAADGKAPSSATPPEASLAPPASGATLEPASLTEGEAGPSNAHAGGSGTPPTLGETGGAGGSGTPSMSVEDAGGATRSRSARRKAAKRKLRRTGVLPYIGVKKNVGAASVKVGKASKKVGEAATEAGAASKKVGEAATKDGAASKKLRAAATKAAADSKGVQAASDKQQGVSAPGPSSSPSPGPGPSQPPQLPASTPPPPALSKAPLSPAHAALLQAVASASPLNPSLPPFKRSVLQVAAVGQSSPALGQTPSLGAGESDSESDSSSSAKDSSSSSSTSSSEDDADSDADSDGEMVIKHGNSNPSPSRSNLRGGVCIPPPSHTRHQDGCPRVSEPRQGKVSSATPFSARFHGFGFQKPA
eukprot:gene28298-31409_t